VRKKVLALAPALALAATAAWSTCRVVGAGAGVPGDGAWARAAAAVRAEHRPGDLIVFAPDWIDPVGRLHLGDLIPVEMAARLDADRYRVIWELSIRGARAAETRGLRPGWTRSFAGVTVRRFERDPAEVLVDFADRAGTARVEGARVRGPDVVIAEVGFAPHRCIQVVPAPGGEATLTFAGVELGSSLGYGVGLADVFTRRDVRAPGELRIAIDGREVDRVRFGVDDGWRHRVVATTPGTASVTFTVAAIGKKARDRLVCFAAEARR